MQKLRPRLALLTNFVALLSGKRYKILERKGQCLLARLQRKTSSSTIAAEAAAVAAKAAAAEQRLRSDARAAFEMALGALEWAEVDEVKKKRFAKDVENAMRRLEQTSDASGDDVIEDADSPTKHDVLKIQSNLLMLSCAIPAARTASLLL